MYQAVEKIAADMHFNGEKNILADASRTRTLCTALAETADRLQEEGAKSALHEDRLNMKTLGEGFRAAARLVQRLHEIGAD